MKPRLLMLIALPLLLAGTISPGRAYAACANPTGTIGEIFYNGDFNVMQFCDGTDWVGMGGGSGGAGVTDGDKGDITVSGSGANWLIDDDLLDFTEFKDALSLDASTDIAISGSQILSLTNTGTGDSFLINDQASDTTPFVIDAAGSVGVGLAIPTQALDVVGKTTSNSFIAKPITGAAAPSTGSAAGQWTTDGTHVWRATGNVGIGTTSPTEKLHVDGAVRVGPSHSTNVADAGVLDYSGGYTRLFSLGPNSSTRGGFQLTGKSSDGSIATTYLHVSNGGNVGIGTTSPIDHLTVNGMATFVTTVNDHGVRITADGANTHAKLQFTNNAVSAEWAGILAYPTGAIVLNPAGGNVGVATATPLGRLHVVQPTACCAVPGTADGAALRLDGPSPTIEFYDTDNASYWINHNQNDQLYWHRWNGSSWVVMMNLTTAGYLSTAGGGVWSDIRLKKDIAASTYGLSSVMALKPVSFHWKDKAMGEDLRIGLIAQDVERVIPELVRTDNQIDIAGKKSERKSVDCASLTVPLIKAVQELKADNDNQAEEIKSLRAEIEALKAAR